MMNMEINKEKPMSAVERKRKSRQKTNNMAAEELAEYKASENKRCSELRKKQKSKNDSRRIKRLFTSVLFKKSC